jgi:hypothetical protein
MRIKSPLSSYRSRHALDADRDGRDRLLPSRSKLTADLCGDLRHILADTAQGDAASAAVDGLEGDPVGVHDRYSGVRGRARG